MKKVKTILDPRPKSKIWIGDSLESIDFNQMHVASLMILKKSLDRYLKYWKIK